MKNDFVKVVFKVFIVLLCSIGLCSCASIGNKQIVRSEITQQIKEGESTKSEVKALIGEPAKVSFTANDEEVWDYYHQKSTMRATSLIPIIGIFAGGADTKCTTLTIQFTKEGIVKKIGQGKSSGGAGSVFDLTINKTLYLIVCPAECYESNIDFFCNRAIISACLILPVSIN